jgi:hypothetical protein
MCLKRLSESWPADATRHPPPAMAAFSERCDAAVAIWPLSVLKMTGSHPDMEPDGTFDVNPPQGSALFEDDVGGVRLAAQRSQ